jgi:thioredoxin-like negative regulator of GroEL
MFSGYLLYQRYFNGILFSERLCNKAALDEFRRGMVVYPKYSQLQKLIDSVKDVPESTVCQGVTEEVTIEQVLQKEKESEEKQDWEHAIYYQGQASVIEPENVEVRMHLAQMYITIGAYDNALVEYSDILAIDPKNKQAYQNYYKVKTALELGIQMSP